MLYEIDILAQKYAQTFMEFENSIYCYKIQTNLLNDSNPLGVILKFRTLKQALKILLHIINSFETKFKSNIIKAHNGVLLIDGQQSHFIYTTRYKRLLRGKLKCIPIYKGTLCEKYMSKILKSPNDRYSDLYSNEPNFDKWFSNWE